MTKFRIPEIAFGALLVIAVISVVWILRPQLLCSCNQVEQGWWEKFQNDPIEIFTLGLVVVGLLQGFILWQQKNLTENLELPIPIITGWKLVAYAHANGPLIPPDPVPPGRIPDFCRFLIGVHNAGRSPMTITRFCIEWTVAPTLPPEPHYVHFEGWNALIPSNQGSWARATQIGDIRLTPLQHAEIIDQHAFLWVFGFFCYSALGNRSIDVGFLVRWDTSQGFVPEPNRAYEYQRKSNV